MWLVLKDNECDYADSQQIYSLAESAKVETQLQEVWFKWVADQVNKDGSRFSLMTQFQFQTLSLTNLESPLNFISFLSTCVCPPHNNCSRPTFLLAECKINSSCYMMRCILADDINQIRGNFFLKNESPAACYPAVCGSGETSSNWTLPCFLLSATPTPNPKFYTSAPELCVLRVFPENSPRACRHRHGFKLAINPRSWWESTESEHRLQV